MEPYTHNQRFKIGKTNYENGEYYTETVRKNTEVSEVLEMATLIGCQDLTIYIRQTSTTRCR